MVLSFIETVGLIAAALTTLSFVPQAIMVLRTRKTEGISVLMYGMFVTGVAIWVIYGFMIGSTPVIIANAFTFLFAACVFVVTVLNRIKDKAKQ